MFMALLVPMHRLRVADSCRDVPRSRSSLSLARRPNADLNSDADLIRSLRLKSNLSNSWELNLSDKA
jgi:hypothetical protein